MKPSRIMTMISRRAIASRLTLKGFVTKFGISFNTYLKLESPDLSNSSVASVAAWLRLMESAQVPREERYIQLDFQGDRIIVVRAGDFHRPAGIFPEVQE